MTEFLIGKAVELISSPLLILLFFFIYRKVKGQKLKKSDILISIFIGFSSFFLHYLMIILEG
jgi:hypothetical protein